jgi:hypothetical protein
MVFGLFRRDPSVQWPVVEPVPLRFDPAARTLNGLPLGAPTAALIQFGRPDDPREARNGIYEYRALGLTIGAEGGQVEWFAFSFGDPARADHSPCTLYVPLPEGGALELTTATRLRDVELALGRPERRTDDNGERIVEFQVAASWLEFAVTLDGRLLALDVDLLPPRANVRCS